MKVGLIKKTVVALVVSTAASAGMTGAAFASKNTHKYQTSGEAQRQQIQTVDPCDGIWNQFANDVTQAAKADHYGQTGARDNWLVLADGALDAGKKAGCDWAARTAPPTVPPTVVQTAHLHRGLAPVALQDPVG
jgi:hypothetical protein